MWVVLLFLITLVLDTQWSGYSFSFMRRKLTSQANINAHLLCDCVSLGFRCSHQPQCVQVTWWGSLLVRINWEAPGNSTFGGYGAGAPYWPPCESCRSWMPGSHHRYQLTFSTVHFQPPEGCGSHWKPQNLLELEWDSPASYNSMSQVFAPYSNGTFRFQLQTQSEEQLEW